MGFDRYYQCGNCTQFPCDDSGGHLRWDPVGNCSDFTIVAKDKLRVYKTPLANENNEIDDHFRYFDDKNKFVPKILADEILHENDIITYQDTKEIALYVGGVFVVDGGEDALRLSGLNKLGTDFKRDRINEVIEYIKLNTLVKRQNINQDPNLINLRNGMYMVDTNELIPHDAKYLSTIQLNVVYDESAQCEEVDTFLNDVAEPKDIPVLVQYVGYSCTEDIKQQRALMIEGPRSNGKSTFLDLVCNMIGQENVAEQSIQALNTDRFSRAQLNGKLVNIFPDLSKKKIYDNTVFKMLTTDEYIDGEEKYVRKFRFKNKCHQMYSANVVPDVDDPDEMAYFRRWILTTFPNIFEGKKADKHLIDKLTTEYEMAGFFNICMIGLRALLKHDDFCDKSSVKDIQKRYLIKSNPIRAFLDECIEYSEHDLIKRDLFDIYEAWCKNKNITTTIKDNVFGRKIKKIGYEDGREANEQRKTVWKNIGISFHGLYCQGSVKDTKITLTDLKEPTDTDNTPVRQGSKDTYPIVEKYKKIYNTIYSEEVVYDLNPGTLTDSKKHHAETPDNPQGLINNPDGTLTNPDESQKDQRTRIKDVHDIILSIQSGNGNRATRAAIKAEAEDIGIDDTDDILKHMASQGQVLQHEADLFQVI